MFKLYLHIKFQRCHVISLFRSSMTSRPLSMFDTEIPLASFNWHALYSTIHINPIPYNKLNITNKICNIHTTQDINLYNLLPNEAKKHKNTSTKIKRCKVYKGLRYHKISTMERNTVTSHLPSLR